MEQSRAALAPRKWRAALTYSGHCIAQLLLMALIALLAIRIRATAYESHVVGGGPEAGFIAEFDRRFSSGVVWVAGAFLLIHAIYDLGGICFAWQRANS